MKTLLRPYLASSGTHSYFMNPLKDAIREMSLEDVRRLTCYLVNHLVERVSPIMVGAESIKKELERAESLERCL
jgi:hypothetical protein